MLHRIVLKLFKNMVQKQCKYGQNTGNTLRRPWYVQQYETKSSILVEHISCHLARNTEDDTITYSICKQSSRLSLNKDDRWSDPCAMFPHCKIHFVVDWWNDTCLQGNSNAQEFCNLLHVKLEKQQQMRTVQVLVICRSGKYADMEILVPANVKYIQQKQSKSPYCVASACSCRMCCNGRGNKSMTKCKGVKNKITARQWEQEIFC